MSEQLLVRLTKWNRSRDMFSPMRQKHKEPTVHQWFQHKLSSSYAFVESALCTIVSVCSVALVSTFPEICSVKEQLFQTRII